MAKLLTTFFLLTVTLICAGQTKNKISGTWVFYKMTVDNQDVEYLDKAIPFDTIFIDNETFEQRIESKNEDKYRQTGTMTLKKGKIILSKRATSVSEQYGLPADIYYRFQIKGEILIISRAAVINEKFEDNSVKLYYRKLAN